MVVHRAQNPLTKWQQLGKEELRFKNIVKFKKVKGNKLPDLSPEVVKNLNHDQQVLYHFTKAATTGPSYFVCTQYWINLSQNWF